MYVIPGTIQLSVVVCVVLVRSVPGTGTRAVPGQVLVLYISLNCVLFY